MPLNPSHLTENAGTWWGLPLSVFLTLGDFTVCVDGELLPVLTGPPVSIPTKFTSTSLQPLPPTIVAWTLWSPRVGAPPECKVRPSASHYLHPRKLCVLRLCPVPSAHLISSPAWTPHQHPPPSVPFHTSLLTQFLLQNESQDFSTPASGSWALMEKSIQLRGRAAPQSIPRFPNLP